MADDEAIARPTSPVPPQRRRRRPPRKFVIQSTFGNARRPRSRKNRPCDACRKRKTACVITADPPCQSCKRRGVPCLSSTDSSAPAVFDSDTEQTTSQQSQFLSPNSHFSGSTNAPAVAISSSESRSPVSPGAPIRHTSPAVIRRQHISTLPRETGPAVLVHETLFHRPLHPTNINPETLSVTKPTVPAVIYTLEDNPGRCAYFMGQSSEQDGFLLDAFKYGILRDNFSFSADIAQVQALSSSSPNGQESPVHFLLLRIEHPEHVNNERERISAAIENTVSPNGDNLVRLFFRHVHPVFPIVSKVRFLTRYGNDKKSIPACLRGVIYGLASVFWNRNGALKRIPMPFKQHELIDYAYQVLRREIENPNLFILQACLLLQHSTPPMMDTLEAPTTWTTATQATACAQMIGLHVEPKQWNIDSVEKHLRRKLWWATFYTDCWSSVSHGSPPHISGTSYTTTAPTMDDMRCDEDVPEDLHYLVEPEDRRFQVSAGARFLQLIDIARSLRIVLDSNYQVNMSTQSLHGMAKPHTELLAVEASLRDWKSLIPSCLDAQVDREGGWHVTSLNFPLHLSFYSAQVLVYRALMQPSTREAKFNPSSNLRKWLPDALTAFDAFLQFLSCLNSANIRNFWGRHARSQLILCGNFLIFLFLLSSEKQDIEKAYGLLEKFHQTIGNLWVATEEVVVALLRATKDRIDSFFTQAAEIMRHGAEPGVSVH